MLTGRRYVSKALPAQPTGNVSQFFRADLSRWQSRYGASFCSHEEIILNITSVGEENWFGFKNCQDAESQLKLLSDWRLCVGAGGDRRRQA